MPSRISFRVASYRDSQTILDGKGAEALIGKGDMLFIPPGSSTFVRAQGAFVSDDEINGIVDFLKINGPPQIIEEVREQIEAASDGDILGDSMMKTMKILWFAKLSKLFAQQKELPPPICKES